MAKTVFTLQLMDALTGKLLTRVGGQFIITTAGSPLKLSLQNPDSNYAVLANPITPTYGRLRFAVDAKSPVEIAVDIFGFAGDGRFVVARGITAGDSEILVTSGFGQNLAIIPAHITDYPAASETDTGLDWVTGTIIDPFPWVNVTVADSTETLDVGFLNSESSGDADGLIAAISVGTATRVVTKLLATATLGALLREAVVDSGGTNTSPTRIPLVVGSTNKSISMTTTTGSDTFEGYVCIPFWPPAPA
jgi:hypothetical protein